MQLNLKKFAMRFIGFLALLPCLALSTIAMAQPAPPEGAPGEKKNANPCAQEVAAALQKLRKSSWFRMNTRLITERGPTNMQIDYVLPDRMHQTVTVVATGETSEIVLVGAEAWSKQSQGGWRPMAGNIVEQLQKQMQENVLQEQTDVGDYSCKGRTQFEGKDVMSYKLESEKTKEEGAPQNQTFRMFYVDAVTGLPASNALLVPGREEKPIFKTTYSFPVDLSVERPKDIEKQGSAAPAPATPSPPTSAAPKQ